MVSDRSPKAGLIVLVLLSACLLPIWPIMARTVYGFLDEGTISSGRLKTAINLSTSYLAGSVRDNGRFIYKLPLTRKNKNQYNMVRHAGALYALAQSCRRYPDKTTCDAMVRAAQFFIKHRVVLNGQGEMAGICSHRSGVAQQDMACRVKLGAVGLGLAALINVEKVRPGTIPLQELRKFGRFLLFMQKKNGSFYSLFTTGQSGRSDKKKSLYYPGEAALGLLMLNELDPSSKWRDNAARALAFLIKQRPLNTSDQWLPIAAARLMSCWNYPDHILAREIVVQFVQQICRKIIEEQILFANDSALVGGFREDGRTTPTATRTEALLAARAILKGRDPMLYATLQAVITSAVRFLLHAQVTSGARAGGIYRVTRLRKKERRKRADEIRIDYVQHCLCVFLGFAGRNSERITDPRLSGHPPWRPHPTVALQNQNP